MEKTDWTVLRMHGRNRKNKMHDKRTKACQHKSDHHDTIIIVREKIRKRTEEKSRKTSEEQENARRLNYR